MEEIANTSSDEALDDHLFSDDFFHTDFLTASPSIFLPEESMGAENPNPGNTATHWKQERRPWLKESNQANSGNEEVRPMTKLQSAAVMRKKKKQDSKERTLYQEVMEEVANKTREAFLKHFGDDSVHVRFQQLWNSKMANKKVKLGHLSGKLPPVGPATRIDRTEEWGSGSFSKEKDPLPAPSRTTTSIPLQGQSIQFQGFPTDQDGNGRISKSAAYRKLRRFGSCRQQPCRPWLEPAPEMPNSKTQICISKVPKPRKLKPQNPAKKQQLRQPWLKQNESGGSKHQQDEERDSIFECFLHQMLN
ncbi:hypothetical protein V6N13_013585 [Hibiscus sabdariffa]|uniref:Uncharacterized protein n=2 Tax=Hibiscus sabdariffa TaxID=183260 RepID=A0ABR2P298_9ROSI